MLAALLAFEGYQVTTAANGQDGLDMILREEPTVAFVDIGLPKLDGYQVARAVRDGLRRGRVHLVALTGYGREEDHEAVLDAGFDEHLVKPVNMKELKASLNRAVKITAPLGIDARDR